MYIVHVYCKKKIVSGFSFITIITLKSRYMCSSEYSYFYFDHVGSYNPRVDRVAM